MERWRWLGGGDRGRYGAVVAVEALKTWRRGALAAGFRRFAAVAPLWVAWMRHQSDDAWAMRSGPCEHRWV